ncbi:MAG: hypothetical protein LH606_11815 [Cytophagaceae bacterium]|nr:hypothetical protein [Cytophagaceae bacterium]
MNFDTFGHLMPYAVIETDLDAFESIFVTGFPESITRKRIFEQYVAYAGELRGLVGDGFCSGWMGVL